MATELSYEAAFTWQSDGASIRKKLASEIGIAGLLEET
jgi:hypothetical protein